jgi:hypothetical protein
MPVTGPADIVGNYDWKWIGSFGIDNQQVKTQQMLTLLKILPALPPDAGVNVKWPNFMIKLMRDGFQIRDVENVIETEFLNASTDPGIENKLLEQGGSVMANTSDDDALHVRVHQDLLGKTKDPYHRALIDKHIKEHGLAAEKKAQMQQMMQMQMQLSAGQPGANKGPQGNRNNPMGNQTQISESTDPSDYERGLGV